MYACLIITGKRLDRSVPNLHTDPPWPRDVFISFFLFFIGADFGFDWVGRGKGKGGEAREEGGGTGRGC